MRRPSYSGKASVLSSDLIFSNGRKLGTEDCKNAHSDPHSHAIVLLDAGLFIFWL